MDGRTVAPGVVPVEPGTHQVAALVDGLPVLDEPVSVAAGETLVYDVVIPPPRAPLAVVVENHPDARPQSGLTAADVVYETLAEGGISRYLALFLSGDAPVVGPVRSLRHYFAFLAAEYGADLVHIGASPQGFAWRDAMQMGKLDESAGDPGVWRIAGRYAPHNAYTNTATDRALLAARGFQQGSGWGPLRFDPAAPLVGQPVDGVSLIFWPSPYSVDWAWDGEQQRFRRFVEGVPQQEAESGEPVTAGSVIVQFARIEPIPGDDKGRVDVGLSEEEGRLLVFTQGTMREGTWSKGLPHEPTRWWDTERNAPLALPPGPVWVEIVPTTASVAEW